MVPPRSLLRASPSSHQALLLVLPAGGLRPSARCARRTGPHHHHHHYATVALVSQRGRRPVAAASSSSSSQRRRGLSSGREGGAGGEEGSGAAAAAKGVLIYKGGHGAVIRTLKRVSLTTCAIGLASTPFFLALGSESVPMAANAALTGVVLLATCGPTVLLHAFTKPYIFSLRSLPPPADDGKAAATTSSSGSNSDGDDQRFRAETMDFLTRRSLSEFRLSEVQPLPNTTRPFVTFQANGRLYFVHGETFADKALLQKLLGRPLKEAEAVPVDPPEEDEEE